MEVKIDNFDELINKAKERSKEKFLKFANSLYEFFEDVIHLLVREKT